MGLARGGEVNVGSTFSGVGGFDLGFERAGMSVVWQAEIDEWSRRVLQWHWPDATIYDDVRAVHAHGGSVVQGSGSVAHPDAAKRKPNKRNGPDSIDLLCGGFPCQDLSVAGKRAGLAGERSGLFFEFARIANEFRPRWIVLENVVGLLSSADGRDFGQVLSTMAQIGYGLSWRVADARYFGVPQRRRRVFIVGCLGDDGERAVRALGTGGEGDFETSDCSWQVPSTGVEVGARGSSGAGAAGAGVSQPFDSEEAAKCLTTSNQRLDPGVETFINTATHAFPSTLSNSGIETSGVSPTLTVGSGLGISSPPAVRIETEEVSKTLLAGYPRTDAETETFVTTAIQASGPPGTRRDDESSLVPTNTVSFQLGNTKANGSNVNTEGVAYTLDRAAGQGVLAQSVRRLTPVECERLMGWPDGWTAVDGDATPDTRRYAACGNGVVANVSEWIGRRIMAIDKEDGLS
jgi:DNA (cytosine-5)-methyltransferase 1